jgi:hypothetical protein
VQLHQIIPVHLCRPAVVTVPVSGAVPVPVQGEPIIRTLLWLQPQPIVVVGGGSAGWGRRDRAGALGSLVSRFNQPSSRPAAAFAAAASDTNGLVRVCPSVRIFHCSPSAVARL